MAFFITSCEVSSKPESTSANKKVSYEKKEACELITSKEVATVYGWNEQDIYTRPQMNLRKSGITSCFYKNTVTQDALLARFSWSSDAAIKNNTLVNHYKNALENGINNFTYKQVQTDATQSLFGAVTLKNGSKNFHLKKRYENYLEIGVDITTTDSDDQKQQQLLEELLNTAKK